MATPVRTATQSPSESSRAVLRRRRNSRVRQRGCEFHYRESIFKRRKEWIIFSTELRWIVPTPPRSQKTADDILKVRNEKFPRHHEMRGQHLQEFPAGRIARSRRRGSAGGVVREGKVPAAYFLEQVGAKGMKRGDIHVADYHANLIYNAGQGTADSCARSSPN